MAEVPRATTDLPSADLIPLWGLPGPQIPTAPAFCTHLPKASEGLWLAQLPLHRCPFCLQLASG